MTVVTLSLIYAVSAFVWISILVQPYGILEGLPKVFVRAPEKVMHVLFQCEKCFAGQLSFWTYPLIVYLYDGTYRIDQHFLVILFSIFFAAFIGKIYNRL